MSLVLSLGSINADFLAKVDAPISSAGTYPGRQLLRTSGGKAANVAVLATAMTGIDATDVAGAVKAARALHEAGGATAYVKLAEGGCAVCGTGDPFVVHPPAGVEAVDATGAGDAFAGGLAFAFSQGHGRTDATQIAVAAASCAVTRFGSQESYPSPEGLQRMIERVRRANTRLA